MGLLAHAASCPRKCLLMEECSLGGVDPVLGLLVFRVINLLGRVDGRVEVLQDAAGLLGLAIDQQLVAAGTGSFHKLKLLLWLWIVF